MWTGYNGVNVRISLTPTISAKALQYKLQQFGVSSGVATSAIGGGARIPDDIVYDWVSGVIWL